MKIALIGYGKMGRMIDRLAQEAGHSIVARLNCPDWNPADLGDADVCLEFTRPECVVENTKKAAAANKCVVIGTTGWDDHLDEIHRLVQDFSIGVLYSPNFSIGVHLFFELLATAAKSIRSFPEYEAAGVEYHHSKKRDCPSGTAKAMAEILKKQGMPELSISSVRCGTIPGTHEVVFDSPCDTLTIRHEARNREGFATGAIRAGEWLIGRRGLYTFADYLACNLHETIS